MVIVGEPSSPKDPKTYGNILSRVDQKEWLMAVEVKLGNMRRHKVWVVTLKEPGTGELDTVWVFKRKFEADGGLLKYKACLCVCGFQQIEGIYYNETFAPTSRLATLQLLLGIAAVEDFDIQQMDVWCAFLNGVPKEDLFIKEYLVQCTRPDPVFSPNFLITPPKHIKNYSVTPFAMFNTPRRMVSHLARSHELTTWKPADASYATANLADSFSGSAILHNGLIGWH